MAFGSYNFNVYPIPAFSGRYCTTFIETLGPSSPSPGDGWAGTLVWGGDGAVQENSQLLFSILLPLFNPVVANPAIMEINHVMSTAVEMLGSQLYQLTGDCC